MHDIVSLIAQNALKLTYAYLYFKKFCMDKQITVTSLPLPTLPWGKKNFYEQKPD
jgi:hypothetical protein